MMTTNINPSWQEVVKKNIRKSYAVIALFVAIFFILGLFIDTLWNYMKHNSSIPSSRYFSIVDVLYLILMIKIFPWATTITVIIASIWIYVTFTFHDRIMLKGTNYCEILSRNENPFYQYIYNIVEEMKIAANMSYMPKIYLIKAEYMNAFASGISEKSSMIAVTSALVTRLRREELQAVMAHELTHIRNYDIKLNLFVIALSNMLIFMVDFIFFYFFLGKNRNRHDNSNILPISFAVITFLRVTLPFITCVMLLFLSRTREYMADAGAVDLMSDNLPMANALIKISQNHHESQAIQSYEYNNNEYIRRFSYIFDPNISKLSDNSFNDIFSTHPSLKKRLISIGIKI